MEDKWKLAQFLSNELNGISPRNIYYALCDFEDIEEKKNTKRDEK